MYPMYFFHDCTVFGEQSKAKVQFRSRHHSPFSHGILSDSGTLSSVISVNRLHTSFISAEPYPYHGLKISSLYFVSTATNSLPFQPMCSIGRNESHDDSQTKSWESTFPYSVPLKFASSIVFSDQRDYSSSDEQSLHLNVSISIDCSGSGVFALMVVNCSHPWTVQTTLIEHVSL